MCFMLLRIHQYIWSKLSILAKLQVGLGVLLHFQETVSILHTFGSRHVVFWIQSEADMETSDKKKRKIRPTDPTFQTQPEGKQTTFFFWPYLQASF